MGMRIKLIILFFLLASSMMGQKFTSTITEGSAKIKGNVILEGLIDGGHVTKLLGISNDTIYFLNRNDTLFISNDSICNNLYCVPLPESGGDTDWVEGSGVVYNNTDDIAIGQSSAAVELDVNGRMSLLKNNSIYIEGGNDTSTGVGNIAIGVNSGKSLSTGTYNTSIGSDANEFLSTGSFNMALGNRALEMNSNGSNNVAMGYRALENPTSPDRNVGVGTFALISVSGDDNVGVGYYAAYSGGSDNVAIGSNAGRLTGDGGVYIGYNAGYSETGDNKLHIANNASTSLIYGEFDNELVLIDGKLGYTNNGGTATSLVGRDGTYLTGLTLGANINLSGGVLSADDTNYYPNGLSFSTLTGILTLNRSGLGSLTTDLDGRYLTSADNLATDNLSFNTERTHTVTENIIFDVSVADNTIIDDNGDVQVARDLKLGRALLTNLTGAGNNGQVLTSGGSGDDVTWTDKAVDTNTPLATDDQTLTGNRDVNVLTHDLIFNSTGQANLLIVDGDDDQVNVGGTPAWANEGILNVAGELSVSQGINLGESGTSFIKLDDDDGEYGETIISDGTNVAWSRPYSNTFTARWFDGGFPTTTSSTTYEQITDNPNAQWSNDFAYSTITDSLTINTTGKYLITLTGDFKDAGGSIAIYKNGSLSYVTISSVNSDATYYDTASCTWTESLIAGDGFKWYKKRNASSGTSSIANLKITFTFLGI
jgi:hypothetical protein